MIGAFLCLLTGLVAAAAELILRRRLGLGLSTWAEWSRLLSRRHTPRPALTALVFALGVGLCFLAWESMLRFLFLRSAPDLVWLSGLVFFVAALGFRLVNLGRSKSFSRLELLAFWGSWVVLSSAWFFALVLTPWILLRARFLKWSSPVSVSS